MVAFQVNDIPTRCKKIILLLSIYFTEGKRPKDNFEVMVPRIPIQIGTHPCEPHNKKTVSIMKRLLCPEQDSNLHILANAAT